MIATQIAALQTGQIVSIAGVGYTEGVLARDADIGWPMGVIRRSDGDLIFADIRGHRLWRIDTEGILHSFLGDGVPGTIDGEGVSARVYTPHDMCVDPYGTIFLSQLGARGPDEGPNLIRRVDPFTSQIDTVVGSGRQGRAAEGLHAREVEMDTTTGVAVAADSAIHFCSKWDSCVFRVDPVTEIVERIAGQTTRHYQLDADNRRPYSGAGFSFAGYHGDSGPARECALHFPEHLAFNTANDLYICDNGSNRIRRIDARSGHIHTVLGTGVAASNGDGGPATAAATNGPDGIFVDRHENLWVSETRGYRLRRVDTSSGTVTTHAGCGLPGWGGEKESATETRCNHLESGIWVDGDGSALYSDSSGRLRRVDTNGVVSTVAGGTSIRNGSVANSAFLGCPTGICVGPDGTIYFADMVHDRIRAIDPDTGIVRTVAGSGGRGFGGDGGRATDAYLLNPYDVAVDREGRLLISDAINVRVRRVGADGLIETIAGTGEATDGGDGGAARNASFAGIHGIACSPNGDVYVGDTGGRIRVINEDGDGMIRTVAGVGIPGWSGDGGPANRARIGAPAGIAFGNDNSVYFCDLTQHVVRRIDPNGVIQTVAGSGQPGYSVDGTVATEAKLSRPIGVAVGSDDTLYFSDARNNRVRVVSRNGILNTVAGSDQAGDSPGPITATQGRLNEPHGLWLHENQLLLICDHYNNRIKVTRLSAPASTST